MQTISTITELRQVLSDAGTSVSTSIGLVPTMGALHEGHLSLVQASKQRCDVTVVSIFVNPTQFAANEDLGDYPRPLESDLEKLNEIGVDFVFAPSVDEVYPPGCTAKVRPPEISTRLEGESRPTHFGGVATVVLKLFNMSGADVAFFGQKDLQQSLIIRQMVRDLNVPIEIDICPIVRDEDGLALSSRNVYLSAEDRPAALALSRTVREAEEAIVQGDRDARALMAQMTQSLIEGGVTETDYALVANADTLEPLEEVNFPVALLVAARVGSTRLIDNIVIVDEPD